MIKKNINLDYNKNVFNEIGQDWALITAGGKNGFNPMTVSWGGLGVLWNKKVAILFVRPQRYTMKFLNENEKFTLSFFSGKYKDELMNAGRISGKGINKFESINLTPIYDVDADIYYAKEATHVFKLKKLYVGDIKEEDFIDKSLIDINYPNRDYHKVIIAEIFQYLENEE